MKIAYLIIAHHKPELLKKLICSLDYPGNDIYLHIDRKSKHINQLQFDGITQFSRLYTIPPVALTWGGCSQINCELKLLRFASEVDHYDYYQLLSGVDIPLMPQAEIHQFFEKNNGKEFVSVGYEWTKRKDVFERFSLYWPFADSFGRDKPMFISLLHHMTVGVERMLNIDRTRHDNLQYAGGGNWFSITGSFVNYILSHEQWIRRRFRFTHACDEIFMQTVLVNSPFHSQLYDGCPPECAYMRAVDWNRGNPYTWEEQDYEELIHSGMLFARKVDDSAEKHAKLVERIYQHIEETAP